ncbi:MAG: hypothetical protein CMJ31_05105 [Phycisphaerae bacterium]|nr:hypothetical protein [Phycisphaerae bacterium]
MATFLITGANRGLGLEAARQLIAGSHAVIATARDPASATDLRATGAEVHCCDVADQSSVRTLADQLDGRAIDVLVNNAGMFPDRGVGLLDLDAEAAAETFRVNSVGPLIVTRALLPNLRLGERRLLINVSSNGGSLTLTAAEGARSYAYRASKAALNLLNIVMAGELRPVGVACVAMHPGWARTDMGGDDAPLGVAESVAAMLRTWERLSMHESGRFVDREGVELPW